jgi:hypothetical protein
LNHLKGNAMSTYFTQLDEIDLASKEMEQCDTNLDRQVTDNRYLSQVDQEGCNAGYGSPYRAAYMKAHGLDP